MEGVTTRYALLLAAALTAGPAGAATWSYSGDASFVYQANSSANGAVSQAGLLPSDFEVEHAHVRLVSTFSERLSVVIAPCLTHHQATSIRYAYVEAALIENDFETLLAAEAGRFKVPFGRFVEGVDPSLYPTVSRPMVFASHDQDVIILTKNSPHPVFMSEFSDIGLALSGGKWLGRHQLTWAAWAGNGMYELQYAGHGHGGTSYDPPGGMAPMHSVGGSTMSAVRTPTDISWLQIQRFESDNNQNKAVGGRLTWSLPAGHSLGASYMGGKYDHHDRLAYAAAGADLVVRLGAATVTAEHVVSPVEFLTRDHADPSMLVEADYVVTGSYVQAFLPAAGTPFELVGTWDRLERRGPRVHAGTLAGQTVDVIMPGAADVTTSTRKLAFGVNYRWSPQVRIKSEFAAFSFSEHPSGWDRVSLGVVVSF